LLRQVAGLATPERGRVCWGGVAVHAMPPRARARHIAYLPQHTLLAFDLRVEELVVLGRAPHLGRFTAPSERDRQAVAAALALVEADHLVGRMVSSLSGG